ncbi:response regulator, partial [bacterium]|nr:response regulator [bacterium]
MCEFMSIMLNKEGYHVRTTTSSMEALKIIGQEDFDLVISDVVMPEIDGVQLLEKIKKTNPETEIIMITAYAS